MLFLTLSRPPSHSIPPQFEESEGRAAFAGRRGGSCGLTPEERLVALTDPFWGSKLIEKVAENILSALKNPDEEAILKTMEETERDDS
jgi:hypothetical protein